MSDDFNRSASPSEGTTDHTSVPPATVTTKPRKPVKLEVNHGATTITYDDFAQAKLSFEQQQLLLEFHSADLERWMEVKREHDRTKTQAIIKATLTPDWRRLIGRAWKLVATLLELRLEAELLVSQQGSGHAFATQADLAARVGVTERTLRNWMNPSYSGKQWLECWVTKRTIYVTREDGYKSRSGTLWRVSSNAKSCADLTPAPKPSLEALATTWRESDDLPQARLERELALLEENSGLYSNQLGNTGNATGSQENVPQNQGRFNIKVELCDVRLNSTCHPRSEAHSGNRAPTAARVLHANTWHKAETIASRLDDTKSVPYWFKTLRRLERAQHSDTAVWSAVGQACEVRDSGNLRKTAGAYARGILIRTASAT